MVVDSTRVEAARTSTLDDTPGILLLLVGLHPRLPQGTVGCTVARSQGLVVLLALRPSSLARKRREAWGMEDTEATAHASPGMAEALSLAAVLAPKTAAWVQSALAPRIHGGPPVGSA
jgi:hypothetical protein